MILIGVQSKKFLNELSIPDHVSPIFEGNVCVCLCACCKCCVCACVILRLSCRQRGLSKISNKIRCSRGNVKNNCVRRYLTTTSEFCDNCMGSSIARDFALLRAGSRYTVARSFNVGIELSMMEIEKQIAEVGEIIQPLVKTVEIYLLLPYDGLLVCIWKRVW